MKIRSEEKHPNGKIYENKFGCHTISEVYVNNNSDIKGLYEIARSFSKLNIGEKVMDEYGKLC